MIARNLFLIGLMTVPLSAQTPKPPVLPAAAKDVVVAPGPYVKLKYHFLAVGKQIYKCENGKWSTASTPDATLYDMNSNLKIRHGAGPSWTMLDGKSTIKAIGKTAIRFPSPDGISIDWLKLDVDRASRTNELADIEIIQRLYTGAGKAPTDGCSGSEVYESPYTAHYYFWSSK